MSKGIIVLLSTHIMSDKKRGINGRVKHLMGKSMYFSGLAGFLKNYPVEPMFSL